MGGGGWAEVRRQEAGRKNVFVIIIVVLVVETLQRADLYGAVFHEDAVLARLGSPTPVDDQFDDDGDEGQEDEQEEDGRRLEQRILVVD